MRALKLTLAALLAMTLMPSAGCAKNDLGSTCQLVRPTCVANCDDPLPENWVIEYPEWPADDTSVDYVSTGGADCENFTCVQNKGTSEAYCSRPCSTDEHCAGGLDETLTCERLVLDEAFIAQLCEQVGEERCQEVFADSRRSSYCARTQPAE